MSRRTAMSRRPSMEPLEARCNPAAIVPFADFSAASGPIEQPETAHASAIVVAPSNPNQSAAVNNRGRLIVGIDDANASTASPAGNTTYVGTANGGLWKSSLPNAPVVDLQLNQNQETLATHELGHTIGLRHEHTKPATDTPAQPAQASRIWEYTPCCDTPAQVDYFLKLKGIDGEATGNSALPRTPSLPSVPAYSLVIDPRSSSSAGSLSNYKYVEDPSRSSIGGDGQDMLLGGGSRDTLERSSHELGHTLGFRHEHTSPASDSRAAGDVNGDGVDDIIVGATINGHVKVFDGATGAEIRSFYAFEGFAGGVRVAAADLTGDGLDPHSLDPHSAGGGRTLGDTGTHEVGHWLGTSTMPASDSPLDQQGRVLIGTDGGIWRSQDDTNGHGTHVAGTIGAVGNNGVGVARPSGGFGYAILVGGASQDQRSSPIVYSSGGQRLAYNDDIAIGLESIIDDLARDVAGARANGHVKVFDARSEGTPGGVLYVATDRGVFIGGDGRDVLQRGG